MNLINQLYVSPDEIKEIQEKHRFRDREDDHDRRQKERRRDEWLRSARARKSACLR